MGSFAAFFLPIIVTISQYLYLNEFEAYETCKTTAELDPDHKEYGKAVANTLMVW